MFVKLVRVCLAVISLTAFSHRIFKQKIAIQNISHENIRHCFIFSVAVHICSSSSYLLSFVDILQRLTFFLTHPVYQQSQNSFRPSLSSVHACSKRSLHSNIQVGTLTLALVGWHSTQSPPHTHSTICNKLLQRMAASLLPHIEELGSCQMLSILHSGPGNAPVNCPFPREIQAPPNTWFLRTTQVHTPTGISIGSTVLAQLDPDPKQKAWWAGSSYAPD